MDENVHEDYYAAIPFSMADAMMYEATSRWPGRPSRPVASRRALTHGSVIYDVGEPNKEPYGAIYVRTAGDGVGTVFMLFPNVEDHEPTMQRRWDWFRVIVRTVCRRAARFSTQDKTQMNAEKIKEPKPMLEIYVRPSTDNGDQNLVVEATTPRRLPKPARNAPLDAWLDWRDSEASFGERVSLASIAGQTNHSLDMLKKRSAQRRKQQ